jgi:tetratricopeptide (TPR) repeat protein
VAHHTRFSDQRLAAWIFGGSAFVVLVYFILFGPKELPPVQQKAFGILSSLLCGLFGYFFTGTMKLVSKGNLSTWGKVGIQAGGGIALFVFVMMWWNSDAAPVRQIKTDIHTIQQTTQDTKALLEKLVAAQTRDTAGRELLAEFIRRSEASRYSTIQKAGSDDTISFVLDRLARDRGMTVDEMRQKMLQTAAGGKERTELVHQFRQASLSEAERMRQIERDGYNDMAAGEWVKQEFNRASDYYRQALALTLPENEPLEWAGLQNFLGICQVELGIQEEGSLANEHLKAGVAAFREALKVFMREHLPQAWVGTKNNLANALCKQAARSEGSQANELLGEAVAVIREVLQVKTGEQSPQARALMHNNLGVILFHQSKRSEGAQANELLGEAVAAFREASKVRVREQLPQAWVPMLNNLGVALREQGERSEGGQAGELLKESVVAFREALKVFAREELPQDRTWADTQNNLGVALREQGERSEGGQAGELLKESVVAFREALKVYTREERSQDWAATQNNMGSALCVQAIRSERAQAGELLGKAVVAFREALKVMTREEFPQDWARTQNNLGNALCVQAMWSHGAQAGELLGEAVAAFREALKVMTREQFPQDWARTQNNLGNALCAQGERSEGAQAKELLGEAVSAYTNALTVFTESFPRNHDRTINNLVRAKFGLASLKP